MTKPPISEAHERLNQIRRWLKSHAHYFRPMDYVRLYAAWRECVMPEHVETLQAYMRAWKLPDEQVEAQKATIDLAVRQAEADRAAWFAAKEEAERQGVSDPPYPTHTTPGQTRIPSTQPTVALP